MGNNQNALTIITHIKPDEVTALNALLTEVGSSLDDDPTVRFRDLAALHFAAWVVITDDPPFPPTLALELNHDGDPAQLLDDLIDSSGVWLHEIYGKCVGAPTSGAGSAAELKRYLLDHAIDAVAFYVGCPGQTVASIRNAIEVRREIERFLDAEEAQAPLDGLSAVEVHQRIKRHLATSSPVKPVVSLVTLAEHRTRAWRNVVLLALVGLPLLVLLSPLLLIWFVMLRIHEIRDRGVRPPPPRPIDPRLLAGDIQIQNHLTTLVRVKPGAFRLYTLKGVLWLVELLARTVFTTGQLGGIPTIHFARWLFIDGNRRLLFFSNYDGSWLSYLGDFIDRANYGLTAVWSNTEEFPPSEYLAFGGAKHVEAFERWSHEHNVYAPVWYSAYRTETLWNLQKDLELRDSIGRNLDEQQAAQVLRLL